MPRVQPSLPRRTFLETAVLGAFAPGAFGARAEAAELSEKEKANVALVQAWAASWKTGDPSKIAGFFEEQCVVRISAGTDRPAWTTREQAAEQIANILKAQTIEFIVQDNLASGPVVLSRQTHRVVSQKGTLNNEVVSVLFVTKGKIKEWHDFSFAA